MGITTGGGDRTTSDKQGEGERRLTDVERTVHEPQVHRDPVEDLALMLRLALVEHLVDDPEEDLGRQGLDRRSREPEVGEGRRGEVRDPCVGGRRGEHGFLVDDDHGG